MKSRLLHINLLLLLIAFQLNAQVDCDDAQAACTLPQFTIDETGPGDEDILEGNNISNPTTNPGAAGNSGCLLSDELNPVWLHINVVADGFLEFTIGQSGGNGFFDWAMWPYYNDATGSSCNDIANNLLPPAACNWNFSSAGYTGMYTQGTLPSGATQGNFEYAIPVQAGDKFILCFSNFSGLSGVQVPLFFGNDIPGNNNPNSAVVNCSPSAPDQIICEGGSTTVTIDAIGFVSPTYNWLVTDGVSDPTGGTDVLVTPSQTTTYLVEVSDPSSPEFPLGYKDTAVFTITVQPQPMPDAGNDLTVCLGNLIPLNGSIADASNAHSWSHITTGITPVPSVTYFPNQGTLNPNVAVNQPGTYRFVHRESNAGCGMFSDTVEVIVLQRVQQLLPTSPSCFGGSDGSVTVSSVDAIEYSIDNGATWSSSPVFSGLSSGIHALCSRNAMGCMVCSSVNLQDPPRVDVTAFGDTLICQNGTASISASAINGNSFIYHWNHTANTSAIQQVSPNDSTSYFVYAESELGCLSDTAQVNVLVREPLSGLLTVGSAVCPGYSTLLFLNEVTGGLGAPYSFAWSTGINHSGSKDSIMVTPAVSQQYRVVITDACESSPLELTVPVTVYPLPDPSFYAVETQICEPALFQLVNTTDPSTVASVEWLIGSYYHIYNEDPATSPPLAFGNYDVKLIVTSPDGCIDSVRYENYLYALRKPQASFVWSPNPVNEFSPQVQFFNTTKYANDYSWTFTAADISSSTEVDPRVKYPEGTEGEYPVTLIASNEDGCYDTVTYVVSVIRDVILFAPNSFSPNGDEFNNTWAVYLQGISIANYRLLVFNRWGEVIWESYDPEAEWDGTLGGKMVPLGTYTWSVEAKDANNDAKYRWNGTVTVVE